jgi:hypothetical protein
VAQALDSLMLSMHTGMIQMPPRQAPVMAAGYHTGPLVQSSGAPVHPAAPRPKPVGPKTTATAAPATAKDQPVPAAPPAPKRSKGRLAVIIVLNLAALLVVGLAIMAFTGNGGAGWKKAIDALYAKLGFSSPVPEAAATPVASVPAPTVEPAAAPQAAPAGKGIMARYVRIEAVKGMIINLAEVEVISGGKNIAPSGTAKQSGTEYGHKAEHAIDGSTSGDESKGDKITHTQKNDSPPYWMVDLGEEFPIEAIVIWNRTDEKWKDRMNKFTVKLRSKHQSTIWEKPVTEAPMPSLRLEVTPP